jgi:hypothetical protein
VQRGGIVEADGLIKRAGVECAVGAVEPGEPQVQFVQIRRGRGRLVIIDDLLEEFPRLAQPVAAGCVRFGTGGELVGGDRRCDVAALGRRRGGCGRPLQRRSWKQK